MHEAAPPARRAGAAPSRSLSLDEYLRAAAEAVVSTALAIAGVTAVLRDLLNDGLINQNVSGVARAARVTVTALPPDRVAAEDGTEATAAQPVPAPGHAQPRLAQRGPALARRRRPHAPEQSAARAQPALPDLCLRRGGSARRDPARLRHAAAAREPGAHARGHPHRAQPSPDDRRHAAARAARAGRLGPAGPGRAAARSRPSTSNTEEMSKLWTATQAHYRPTAAYQVSVVLIEADRVRRARRCRCCRVERRSSRAGPAAAGAHRSTRSSRPASQPVRAARRRRRPRGPSPRRHGARGRAASTTASRSRRRCPPGRRRRDDDRSSRSRSRAPRTFRSASTASARACMRPGETAPRETNRLALTLAPQITGAAD